jgi:hypothetical protein
MPHRVSNPLYHDCLLFTGKLGTLPLASPGTLMWFLQGWHRITTNWCTNWSVSRDCGKDQNLLRTKYNAKSYKSNDLTVLCCAGETRLKKSLYTPDGRVICEREGGRRRHILKGPHVEGGWAWTEHIWKRICGC